MSKDVQSFSLTDILVSTLIDSVYAAISVILLGSVIVIGRKNIVYSDVHKELDQLMLVKEHYM